MVMQRQSSTAGEYEGMILSGREVFCCPTCHGQKTVSRPPTVAGDQLCWQDSGAGPYPCLTCDAKGYIVVGPP